MKADDVADLLPHITTNEKAEIEGILAQDRVIWRPQPGPQSEAFSSAAQITGYGGAAGGGKTDLLCGAMLTRHRRGIIFRREGTQLTGVIDRLAEILGGRGGYNGSDKIWRLAGGQQIEFGSVPNLGDEARYQGRPHDFIGFDEAANFLEGQVRFLLGWLRTTARGQRCRAILAFNPPTTAEGRWVIPFFGPWLDPAHANPAAPGELRWFASVDGKEIEVGPEPFSHGGEIITPTSRTFIASHVGDNPYGACRGDMERLSALQEWVRRLSANGQTIGR